MRRYINENGQVCKKNPRKAPVRDAKPQKRMKRELRSERNDKRKTKGEWGGNIMLLKIAGFLVPYHPTKGWKLHHGSRVAS